ncbi:hypothetical protein HGI30_15170 [Paenibacillus albicereus]|uniref:Uncharacterized protein n=1 Tax=Paenibacillus albicereus TaxID=2726185 RepID=A0A6H2GZB2_9BACL|nr:hypothetical protein [Paenibacillus albicereus]QJC52773.1 hypothetical protein HGI30_15170 [Paenibacillus albicereus]
MLLHIIDIALLIVYAVTIGTATYILAAHRKYFHERFRSGVVSAFMLAMLFFLTAYDIKMLVAIWIRASEVFGFRTPEMRTAQLLSWLIATISTAAGLLLLAYQTKTKKYDLYLFLRRMGRDRKDDGK